MRLELCVVAVLAGVALTTGCGGSGSSAGPQVLAGNSVGPATVTASPAPIPMITPAPSATASATAGSASASPAATLTASALDSNGASPSPTRTSTATLTESDSGRTITLTVGQLVTVNLPGGSSGGYDQPQSSSAAMHRDSVSGGYPTAQPAVAQFTAAEAGAADLTSQTDYRCLHAQPPCMVAQKQWVVHVIVQ
jgi:hypothetical protein